MRMTDGTYNLMNALTAKCFNANAIVDNLAYSLDFHYYTEIADIVHHKVAHVMPEWADLITNEMLMLSARPVRKDIEGYEEDYENVKDVFAVLGATLLDIREAAVGLIEAADMDGDDEVRIFAEDFLACHIQPFIKQADEWINAAYNMDAHYLNVHIKEYTHFINI